MVSSAPENAPKKKHKVTGLSRYEHDFIVDCLPDVCLQQLRYISEASEHVTVHIPVEFDGGARFTLHYYENDRLRVTIEGLLRRWQGTQTSVHCRQMVHETWLSWLIGMAFSLSLLALLPMILVTGLIQSQMSIQVMGGLVLLMVVSFLAGLLYSPFDDVPPNIVGWLKAALRKLVQAQQSGEYAQTRTQGDPVVRHAEKVFPVRKKKKSH
jgi:hypothetical protein